MKERCQHERLIFRFPLSLESITAGRKEVYDLVTRDISASGTFITTLTSFPEGTRFNRANPFRGVCLFCIFVRNTIYVIGIDQPLVVFMARYQ